MAVRHYGILGGGVGTLNCYVKRTTLTSLREYHHKTIVVPIFPCHPSGTILSRTKSICSKRVRTLISISVNYMLGNRCILYTIIQGTASAVVKHNL